MTTTTKLQRLFFLIATFAIMGFSLPWPFSGLFTSNEKFGTYAWFNGRFEAIHSQADNLNPQILRLALKAYMKAHNKIGPGKEILTIIDYSKPSTERRMWVIDLRSKRVLYNTWVTHGRNSGGLSATSFSNQPGSLKSSLGVFLTEETYVGSVGYAVRLKGLEPGINDNAYRRAVVVHGAWYADQNIARRYGQLGRSFGCPAVSEKIAKPLINTIKNNTVVFAYYPDRQWLRRSAYLA
jgi:hypothetical protein